MYEQINLQEASLFRPWWFELGQTSIRPPGGGEQGHERALLGRLWPDQLSCSSRPARDAGCEPDC